MAVKVKHLKDGRTSQYEIAPSSDRSLLELLEAQKAKMPFGCRAGSCGACLVTVTEGEKLLSPVDPMEGDTLSRCSHGPGSRLACRAHLLQGEGALALESPEADGDVY